MLMTSKSSSSTGAPRRQLSLFDTICIIVGIVIGTGIYQTTPTIALAASSPTALVLFWVVGGVLSLIGALCYAELATAYPHSGGDYVFLTRAYGRPSGFLFAWSEFWIVRAGNVGLMAIIFGNYASQSVPLNISAANPHYDHVAYAILSVVGLTATNVLGVKVGKTTQNILTTVKVIALLAIFVVAFAVVPAAEAQEIKPVSPHITLFTAMVLVFFTYGGWNEMSFVAAEVQNPERNILRSLVGGTLLVMAIYICLNLAFLRALGLQGMRDSNAIAADLLSLAMGKGGKTLISILVCLSCLGAINGMLFTGARIFYASGQHHSLAAALAKWNPRFDSPMRALIGQAVVTLVLLGTLGLAKDGFERLVYFTTPVFWLFKLFVAISLFVLRYRDPHTPRKQRVPLYPIVPLVFAATCIFVIYSSTQYALSQRAYEAFIAIGIVLAGIPFAFLGRMQTKAKDTWL